MFNNEFLHFVIEYGTASNNAHGRNQEQKETGNRMTLKLRIWKF